MVGVYCSHSPATRSDDFPTYVEEITLAIVRTLEHASFHKGIRLAGYAANARFWAEEVRHALDCIEGYQARSDAFLEARRTYAATYRVELDSALTTPSITPAELAAIKRRLLVAATQFFRVCGLDRGEAQEISLLLGIRATDDSVQHWD